MKKIIVIAISLVAVACAAKNQTTTGTTGASTTREDSTATAATRSGQSGDHGTAGATGSHAGTGGTTATGSTGTNPDTVGGTTGMGGSTDSTGMGGATDTTGSTSTTGMESSGSMERGAGMGAMEFSTKEEFLAHVQHVNEMEIQAGQLAQKNATNPKVKQFGMTLVTDHKKAQAKIKSMMPAATASAPNDPKMMNDPKMKEHHEKMEAMKAMKGLEFERAFLTAMVAGHKDTLDMLEAYQSKADDQKVKSLITELMPTIKLHHTTAENLLANVDRRNTSGQE